VPTPGDAAGVADPGAEAGLDPHAATSAAASATSAILAFDVTGGTPAAYPAPDRTRNPIVNSAA